MKLTENEIQIISSVLEEVLDNANKEEAFNGDIVHNTDDDLLMSFSGEDYKTLKKTLKKLKGV